jgi:four helix bundle protein
MAQEFRELVAWRASVTLVKEIHESTSRFPPGDNGVLADEMRRTAIAIPSTIARGAARHSRQEFLQHLGDVSSLLAALETQMAIATELGYLGDTVKFGTLIEDVAKLVAGLTASLRQTTTDAG